MLHRILISTSLRTLWSKLQVILDRLVGSLATRESSWAREKQGWICSLVLLLKREGEKGEGEKEGGRHSALKDPAVNKS